MIPAINDYYEPETFARIRAFADGQDTPVLVVDTETVRKHYQELVDAFTSAKIYYAVKANPAPEILTLLRDMGSCFDIASVYELDRVLGLDVPPERVSFGNTIKKSRDIRYFYERGVRMFATDSEADLRNIAKAAPGSQVYVRILTEGTETADWPLSRKFGCQSDMAMDLVIMARDLGLDPYGISFHVGSQQRDIGAWDAAIGKVKLIFERLKEEDDIQLRMINLGGGFHHAEPETGGGFCVYNDVAVAVAQLRSAGFSSRIAIVDLDDLQHGDTRNAAHPVIGALAGIDQAFLGHVFQQRL